MSVILGDLTVPPLVTAHSFYDSPNVDFVSFANEEGAFLVGDAAAIKSDAGVIGFFGGAQIPVIERVRAGFEAGAHLIDPDAEVLATFVTRPWMPDAELGVGGFADDGFALST